MISRARRQVDRQQPFDDRGDGGALVEDGNDDRDERLHWRRRCDQRTSTGIRPILWQDWASAAATGALEKRGLAETQGGCPGRDSRPQVAQPLARRCSAQRFFCASLIRLRAAADIFRGPRVRFAAAALAGFAAADFALPADVAPPVLSRRAAQYFRIRSLTALRCAADMFARPRRRRFAAVTTVAATAPRTPRPRSSGNARWIAAASGRSPGAAVRLL